MNKDLTRQEEYELLKALCVKIYLARNLTYSEKALMEALDEIDRWGREENCN
jgi:hypothetical protein